jgi:hypothetical protein
MNSLVPILGIILLLIKLCLILLVSSMYILSSVSSFITEMYCFCCLLVLLLYLDVYIYISTPTYVHLLNRTALKPSLHSARIDQIAD